MTISDPLDSLKTTIATIATIALSTVLTLDELPLFFNGLGTSLSYPQFLFLSRLFATVVAL